MSGFGALNAAATDNDSSFAIFHEVRQEEQEAEALALYNKALDYQKKNDLNAAKVNLLAVLDTDLIIEAAESLIEGEKLINNAALFMKFNVYKKLADIAEHKEENDSGLDFLLEAAVIDESDVSVWWKIAQIAMSTLNIRLARYACEKGLSYSTSHWLFLDLLITILYIIGDYHSCLTMIGIALEKDENYKRGYAIRDQIFKEEPHFKKDCLHLRSLYMEDKHSDKDEYQKCIEEALIIRGKRNVLARKEEPSKLKLSKPIQYYTWLNVGESLLQLYQDLTDPITYQSLFIGVDLKKYQKTEEQQKNLAVPSPDILSKKYQKTTGKDGEKCLKRKRIQPSSQDKETEPQPKRRSTRVRLSRPKDTDVNWSELIYSLLPESFKLPVSTETDDSQESQQSDMSDKASSQLYWGSAEDIKKESLFVSKFINENLNNSGCISLIENFTMNFCDLWEKRWSTGMVPIYESLFEKLHKHVCFPNVYSQDGDVVYMAKLGKLILMSLEFRLDRLHMKNAVPSNASPMKSPYQNRLIQFDKLGRMEFLKDLHYVSRLGVMNKILDGSIQFKIRFFWVQGRYCMIQNENNLATNAFCNCVHLLTTNQIKEIVLHNCQQENIISELSIEKKLDTAHQRQSLDDLNQMLLEKKYADLITLLEPIIENKTEKSEVKFSPERPSHLLILQEAYFLASNFKKSIDCSLLILTEALSSSMSLDPWKMCLNKILKILNSCFLQKESKEYFTDDLARTFCDRFTKLVEFSMDNDQDGYELTTLPWLLIFRMIKWREEKILSSSEVKNDNQENSYGSFEQQSLTALSSFEFLRKSHEYLGRKRWCCHDDGLLLEEFINEGMAKLNAVSKMEIEEIYHDIEQCLYCFYGNPCKKSKSKAIQDHNDEAIPLTWQNSKVLYDFYKPDGLPQLSSRTYTVSFEVQNVFRKIAGVVPQKNIEVIPFDSLQQYIEGGDDFAVEEMGRCKENSGVFDLFYYLGDFYFKNKEFTKALKYYMHDVCIQPTRFQSWAAMAFARGARLEEKINQCDLKNDSLLKKNIIGTLRCFEKAMELSGEKCLVLEEYGQTTYMLQSYYSRKIREMQLEEKPDCSAIEMHQVKRHEMLLSTDYLFTTASKLATTKEGERWLHYYLLGKTAEKLKKPSKVYLDYYQKSLQELYQSGSHYLKKLPYHSPPEYSIEAVELFYRIHASILKILKYEEIIDYDLLETQLENAHNQNIYQEVQDVDEMTSKENEKSSNEKSSEQNVTVAHNQQASKQSTFEAVDLMQTRSCVKEYDANGDEEDEEIDVLSFHNNDGAYHTLHEHDVRSVVDAIVDKVEMKLNELHKIGSTEVNVCIENLIHNVCSLVAKEILVSNKPSDKNIKCDDTITCIQDLIDKVCENVEERQTKNEKDKENWRELVGTKELETVKLLNSKEETSKVKVLDGEESCEQSSCFTKSRAKVFNTSHVMSTESVSTSFGASVKGSNDKEMPQRPSQSSTDNREMSTNDVKSSIAKLNDKCLTDHIVTLDNKEIYRLSIAATANINPAGELKTQSTGYRLESIRTSKHVDVQNCITYDFNEQNCQGNICDLKPATSNADFTANSQVTQIHGTVLHSSHTASMVKQQASVINSNIEPRVSSVVTVSDDLIPVTTDSLDIQPARITDSIVQSHTPASYIDVEGNVICTEKQYFSDPVSSFNTKHASTFIQNLKTNVSMNPTVPPMSTPPLAYSSIIQHQQSPSTDVLTKLFSLSPQTIVSTFEGQFEGTTKKQMDQTSNKSVSEKQHTNSTDKDVVKEILTELVELVSLWTTKPKLSEKNTSTNLLKHTLKLADKYGLHDLSFGNSFIKLKSCIKRSFQTKEEECRYKNVAYKCLNGLGFCLRRFPEHHKSQYTMAHFLTQDFVCKHLRWSRDLLLGSTECTNYSIPLPSHGIFSGKKKTNLFQYLWRIPVNEVDRPGSFCSHICRGVELLLIVLHELKDSSLLLHVASFLHRTPDKEKKYLRDKDRLILATKGFNLVLDVLRKRTKEISDKGELKAHLIDFYDTYKQSQKMQQADITEFYMFEVYEKIIGQSLDGKDRTELHDAINKYCQENKSDS